MDNWGGGESINCSTSLPELRVEHPKEAEQHPAGKSPPRATMLTARTVLLLVLLFSLSPCSRTGPYSPSECCFGHMKRPVRLDNLLGFYSTPRECYSPAIVFETKKGVKICANPEDKWVKRAVTELLKRNGRHAP